MNSITIAGNIGRDAEVRALPDGTPVAQFSVADSQGREKPTIWWSCQLFGKRADSLAQYLLKGQPVTVTGSMTEREYTDRDGNKRKGQDVRVSDVALQGGKRENAEPDRQHGETRDATGNRVKPQPPSKSTGFDDDGSDIPF